MLKIEDLENRVGTFVVKCLLNENFEECRNSCLELLNKVDSFEEFCDIFLSRNELTQYQGYWKLASVVRKDSLRDMVISYLDSKKGNYGKGVICNISTISDRGAIKVGNDSFCVDIDNFGCEGYNVVYVIDTKDDVNLDFSKFVTSIEGTDINIYDYDCGNSVALKLKGRRYGVYAIENLVVFKLWE